MVGWNRWLLVIGIAVLGFIGSFMSLLLIFSASLSDTLDVAPPLPAGFHADTPAPTAPTLIAVIVVAGVVFAVVVGLVLLRAFRGALLPAWLAVASGPLGVWLLYLALNAYGATVDPPQARVGEIPVLGVPPQVLLVSSLVLVAPAALALIPMWLARKRFRGNAPMIGGADGEASSPT